MLGGVACNCGWGYYSTEYFIIMKYSTSNGVHISGV